MNNLTSNTLQIGQELIVSEDSNDEEQIENQNIYVVQRGDSLSKIANTFGVTIDDIKNANNLTSNLIMIGEELIIPDPQNTPDNNEEEQNTYTVKRGDTLYSIAALFGTTVNNLIELNNLTSNVLQIGQELIVPSGTDMVIPDTSVILYTVERGDSLYKIANNYNTTVDAIRELNNLTSDILQIGQILQIPQSGLRSTKQEITYTVSRGDTLFSIAASNNLSVEELKKMNNLKTNAVTLGETLIISE